MPYFVCNTVYTENWATFPCKGPRRAEKHDFPPVGQKDCRNGLKIFFWRKNPKKFL